MRLSVPTYLMLSRHNVFYFRWPLPNSKHLRISLGTRDPKQALQLAKRLEYHAVTVNQKLLLLDMRHADVQKALRHFFTKLLEHEKRQIDMSGSLPVERIDELQHSVSAIEEHILHGGHSGLSYDGDIGDDLANRIITLTKRDMPDLDIPEGSSAFQQFKDDIKLPYLSYCKELLRHNSGMRAYDLSLEACVKTIQQSRPLKAMVDDFIAERVRGGEWTPRTEKDRTAQFLLLCEILGDAFDIARIDAAKASDVKKILQLLPKSRNKNAKTRGLPLQEALAVEGVEKLDVRTVNEYLTAYQSFFNWLEQQGFIEKNPFKNAAIKAKKTKKSKRKAFTPEQIRTILDAMPEHAPEKTQHSYRYWGALIGIYTGARLNEIAQLMLTDIKQKDGIWYFDFNDEDDEEDSGKRLKNESSKREVPIHDALLAHGFIEYVEKLRRQNEKQLFPDLSYQPNFGYGRYLGKWFNEKFLVQLGIKTTGLSFHSLRHSFVTNLRKHVDNMDVKQLVGHSKDDVTEDTYTHEYDLKVLKTAINKLVY